MAVCAAASEDAGALPIRRMPISPSDLFTLRQAYPAQQTSSPPSR